MSVLPNITSVILQARRWECRRIPASVAFFARTSLDEQQDSYFYRYESRKVNVVEVKRGELSRMLNAWNKSTLRPSAYAGGYRTGLLFLGKAEAQVVRIYLSGDFRHIQFVASGRTRTGRSVRRSPRRRRRLWREASAPERRAVTDSLGCVIFPMRVYYAIAECGAGKSPPAETRTAAAGR